MIAAPHAALERLIDYAGLFPPAQLPIGEALATYFSARAGNEQWMLGRFIVRVSDLDMLRAAAVGAPLELSVIASPESFGAVSTLLREGWASVGSLEVPLGDGSIEDCARMSQLAGLGDLPIYVELTRGRLAMEELRRNGLGAKLRCGGVEPAAYPTVAEVATFIDAAVAAGVPFKATAGLHHPVRHFNEAAGVVMHGFLNVLVAASRAGEVDRAGLEAIVAEEDPAALRLSDEASLRRARRERFISYGSCSFNEPVADLRDLGLLA